MTKIENMREDSGLGRLLSECFAGGERLRRELRLSAEQAEELAAAYPADVRPMGGSWYEITFQGGVYLWQLSLCPFCWAPTSMRTAWPGPFTRPTA